MTYRVYGNRRGTVTRYDEYNSVFEAMGVLNSLHAAREAECSDMKWVDYHDGIFGICLRGWDGTTSTEWFIVEEQPANINLEVMVYDAIMERREREITGDIVPEGVIRAGSARKKKEVSND